VIAPPTIAGEFFAAVTTGTIGGFVSGLLGVSSGGILVPLLILILGREQHAAQGLSLVAQIFPTSLGGVRDYMRHGHSISWRWLICLAVGFAAGGILGAMLAGGISDLTLRWSFVGYLVVLMTLMFLSDRRRAASEHEPAPDNGAAIWMVLVAIGFVGGLSSGFLGIGGGLAITALMSTVIKVSQHRAQAFSLAVTALPLTLPAALIYFQNGWAMPWLIVAGVVAGLWVGTLIGSQFANRISERNLRRLSFVFIGAMALYMAFRAMS
jgi:hypothetical protein